MALAATLAAGVALAWSLPLGTLATRFLDAWLSAQQVMLEASGNLNADGRAEFAVLLADGITPAAFRAALAGIPQLRYAREADLPGWVVVEAQAGDRTGLDAVRGLAEARLVVPNRGLWICH